MPPAKKPAPSSPRTGAAFKEPPRSTGSTDRSTPPKRRWWSCARTPAVMSARAPAICTRTYARSSRARGATAANSRRRCSATSSRRRSDSRARPRQGLALPRRRAVRESLKPGPGAAPPRPAEQSPASGNATAMSRARHSRPGTRPCHCGTSGPCVGETPQFVSSPHSGIRRWHFSGAEQFRPEGKRRSPFRAGSPRGSRSEPEELSVRDDNSHALAGAGSALEGVPDEDWGPPASIEESDGMHSPRWLLEEGAGCGRPSRRGDFSSTPTS